jgi:2-C-methyl-D-erythritol 4-phosphate cytidylyltransferase
VEAWAIIVAGGSGSRFGRPKQYCELGGRRLLDWAVMTASECCRGVVVTLPAADIPTTAVPGADAVVPGGATRSGSVRAGLAVVPPSADVIVVHDAARPLAPAEQWAAVLAAVEAGADAAIPAIPITDTIKRVAAGQVVETLDRAQLVAVQTPQAFRACALRAAHDGGREATDDAALVEASGGQVTIVPGDPHNLKITEPIDLEVAALLLARRQGG